MSELFLRVGTEVPIEQDAPAADRVIAESPQFRTWNTEERDGLYCGIWESTPGHWRISYDEWEFCHILSGHSVITDAEGMEHVLKAGDSFILRPGFAGSWKVIETTRKEYVIRT